MLHKPVVLGMEHVVDGGQADILVGAAVASDEVRVEQLVVIDSVLPLPGLPRPISMSPSASLADRHGGMGDVGEEGVPGADREWTTSGAVP